MAVALVQEFKIVGGDRSTANYDHVAQRLDTSCTTAFAGVERARLGRKPVGRGCRQHR